MQMESSGDRGFVGSLKSVIGDYFRALGVLRTPLLLLTVLAIVLAPGADARVQYEGLAFAHTVLLPTLAPLLLAGLLFDSLMSKVMMGEVSEERRRQLRVILRTELIAAVILVLSFLPFLMSIFS